MVLADLAYIRRDARQYLTDRANIYRKDTLSDEYGTPSSEWVIAQRDVPCRLMEERDRQGLSQINDVNIRIERYTLSLPVGTEIEKPCRIDIGGKTYEVDRIQENWTDEVFIKLEIFKV